jgi:uncharacterized Zn-finger protein
MYFCASPLCFTVLSKSKQICNNCITKQGLYLEIFSTYNEPPVLTRQPSQHIYSVDFDSDFAAPLPLATPQMPYMQNPTESSHGLMPTHPLLHNEVTANEDDITPAQPQDTSNQNKPFKCEECHTLFSRKGELTRHHGLNRCRARPNHPLYGRVDINKIRPATSNQNKPFKCEEEDCGKAFTKKYNLNKHMRFMHLGIKPHICSYCIAAFCEKRDLKAHENSAHPKPTPPESPPSKRPRII